MLSVIVVTTDRLRLVERLFLSLAQQTCKDFEVLLMHGTDLPLETVQAVCGRFPELSVRAFPTADSCLSRSRNTALPHIRGEMFCIADDDCVYEPDTVGRVLETFRLCPEGAVLIRTTVGLEETAPLPRECALVRDRWRLYCGYLSYLHLYRATVLGAVRGFDEHLGVVSDTPWQSGEETDFVLRTAQAGFAVMSAPAVVVRHPRPNLRDLTWSKIRGYAAGRMRLPRKHRCAWPFVLVNLLYPLVMLFWECLASSLYIIRYRGLMFWGRLCSIRGAE